MNEKTIKTLSWLVPVLCAVIALVVVGLQWNKLRVAEAKSQELNTKIETVKSALLRTQGGELSKEAAEEAQKDEEAKFVRDLRTMAQQYSVRIMKWNSRQVSAENKDKTAKVQPDDPLKDVTVIQSKLEFVGGYDELRSFLATFLRGRRLVNMTDVQWSRFKETSLTQLSCTLNRYVVPPGQYSMAGTGQPGGPH